MTHHHVSQESAGAQTNTAQNLFRITTHRNHSDPGLKAAPSKDGMSPRFSALRHERRGSHWSTVLSPRSERNRAPSSRRSGRALSDCPGALIARRTCTRHCVTRTQYIRTTEERTGQSTILSMSLETAPTHTQPSVPQPRCNSATHTQPSVPRRPSCRTS